MDLNFRWNAPVNWCYFWRFCPKNRTQIFNKFLEKFQKPTIIFVDSKKEDVLKGSIRSKPGFNVVKAFEELKDFLLTSGGHAQAGGLSIKKDDFEKFKEKFNQIALQHEFIKEDKKTININLTEVNLKNFINYEFHLDFLYRLHHTNNISHFHRWKI